MGESVPIDFISPRVLEHLIRDRGQREEYGRFFKLAHRVFRLAHAQEQREAPFINLVLTQAGADPTDPAAQARCRRLVRWWKLKTKEHRELGTDEAKALRMVLAAFKRGDDVENDPEYRLSRAGQL